MCRRKIPQIPTLLNDPLNPQKTSGNAPEKLEGESVCMCVCLSEPKVKFKSAQTVCFAHVK